MGNFIQSNSSIFELISKTSNDLSAQMPELDHAEFIQQDAQVWYSIYQAHLASLLSSVQILVQEEIGVNK